MTMLRNLPWDGVFLAGFAFYAWTRGVHEKRTRHNVQEARHRFPGDTALLALVFVGTVGLPLLYLAAPVLRFADYARPGDSAKHLGEPGPQQRGVFDQKNFHAASVPAVPRAPYRRRLIIRVGAFLFRAQRRAQQLDVVRLVEEPARAQTLGDLAVALGREVREHIDRDLRCAALQRAQHVETAPLRELDVEHHRVGARGEDALDRRPGLSGVAHRLHARNRVQHRLQALPQQPCVFDKKHFHAREYVSPALSWGYLRP